jgi:Na+/H+-dicarboxylate symporter
MKTKSHAPFLLLGMLLLGVVSGLLNYPFIEKTAQVIAELFMNFLKLLAAPVVFLSILSTLMNMKGVEEMRSLGGKIIKYTLLTTVAATLVALMLFLGINPIKESCQLSAPLPVTTESSSYLAFLIQIVPSNFVEAFAKNNVIAVAFLGFAFGMASLKLPQEERLVLSRFFSSLFKLLLKLTEFIVFAMPIGVWAFTTLLVEELGRNQDSFQRLLSYLSVVLGANILQGVLVLPLLLKIKGLSPLKTFKGTTRALALAFFSKSSNATLPVAIDCAENELKISARVARFSLPLCTVINMNGCAAFILTTVLFVAGSCGHVFSAWDLAMWVALATIAAVGNAGVPMGCFFLSSAFLVGMDVPLQMMGLILPFYALLDMVETALNVWSDICVTTIVDKEAK